MLQSRVDALREHFDAAQIDALLITSPANLRYLSGFTGSAGVLLVDAQRALLITDGRYTIQARAQAPAWDVVTRGQSETLIDVVARLGGSITRLGFEPTALTYADYAAYAQALPASTAFVPVSGLVEQLRMTKDADELATLRQAIAITDQALAHVRPLIQPDRSERALAWAIHQAMVELGAAGPAFEIIVAAGRNSALPHARPTDELLGVDRPIVVDCGALLAGYHADMTRTFIIGSADNQFWSVYNVVQQALQAVTTTVTPATTGQAADAIARTVISDAGYGDYFGHGLGHGVGYEIHEGPRLSAINPDPLPIGAVFSIEPGIYLPEWGGVRLENLALLHAQGIETLTAAPLDNPVVSVA